MAGRSKLVEVRDGDLTGHGPGAGRFPRRVTLDYFCYISHTKVDQLYEAASPDAVDEWIERKTRDRRVDAKASAGLSLAGIAKLFGGEVGYGSGSGVEIEKKVQVKYVEKLRVVLTAIAAEH